MSELSAFVFRVLAGALFAAALGVLVDALFGINGWWLWGLCAGALAGALLAYRRMLANEPAAQPNIGSRGQPKRGSSSQHRRVRTSGKKA